MIVPRKVVLPDDRCKLVGVVGSPFGVILQMRQQLLGIIGLLSRASQVSVRPCATQGFEIIFNGLRDIFVCPHIDRRAVPCLASLYSGFIGIIGPDAEYIVCFEEKA